MAKQYTKPQAEIITFKYEDIVVASLTNGGSGVTQDPFDSYFNDKLLNDSIGDSEKHLKE